MFALHTIRHYVNILRLYVVESQFVAFAQTSRRQAGVLLQGHPRPWPVAKPRTLRVPAHKVPYVRRVSVLLKLSFARAFGGELRGLPPPALRSGQRRRLPLALLTADLLPCPALRAGSLPLCQSAAKTSLSAHFRRSSSKVSRLAACVKYSTPLPAVTPCPWSLPVFLPALRKPSKRPSATKAK